MMNKNCGLTRGELDAHPTWITAIGICTALKPDGTQCNCPYSAHESQQNQSISAEMKKEFKEIVQEAMGSVVVPFIARVNNRLFNPFSPSKISGTRDRNFRTILKTHFGYTATTNKIGCMLTSILGDADQVCAAHILPASSHEEIYSSLGMTSADLNSIRNGLWLARNIEKSFDTLRLSFVPQDILHPRTLKLVIWDEDTRMIPIWDGHQDLIGQYEGCSLQLGGHEPFRRALSYQAYLAHSNYMNKLLPVDKVSCPAEFGTPPSSFIAMRDMLVTQFDTSVREELSEVLQEEV